ncbi:hypothetical protein AB6D11_06365 [Vibrio splendidus]
MNQPTIRPMKAPIIFLNMTRQCNVECPRCYITKENRSRKELLPMDLIEKLLRDPVYQQAQKPPVLAWEGGELSLVGKKALIERLELAQSILPDAQQTMVTNCYQMPNWLINIAKKYMDGHLETTYALGKKYSLAGEEDKYQENFIKSVKKAVDAGLSVTVNIELNPEMAAKGPAALIEIMRKTGAKIWEFDHSIQFDKFLAKPIYNLDGYPVVQPSQSYEAHAQYLIDLVKYHDKDLMELGIQSSILWHSQTLNDSQFFAVQNTDDMVTLTADGSLTTDVVWTDMPGTHIGNLKRQTLSEALTSPIRKNIIYFERIKRVKPCMGCEYYRSCRGGPSFVPLHDGGLSSECAGAKSLYDFMQHEYTGCYDSAAMMNDPIKTARLFKEAQAEKAKEDTDL